MNARRPGAPFSKIVRRALALQRQLGVRHRRLMRPPSAAQPISCALARADGRAEHLGEAVDVGARAPLGDRHEQPAAILLAPGERLQVDARVDALARRSGA